jgi:A/G-specific adenine glycosylase
VQDLAAASSDNIMRMWAGLGYYRRARLLHECAKTICTDYGGCFPSDEAELRKLPGFGAYTAAAVAAIAFGQRANVVDGNVERVMARIFNVQEPLSQAKNRLRALAATMLPNERYGDYAQALMDLGATVCTPRSPKCMLCPWQTICQARALGVQAELPRRAEKKAKPVRRSIAFVLLNKKGEVLLRRRAEEGLLGGMMEVPSSDWRTGPMPDLEEARQDFMPQVDWRLLPDKVVHVFTHFTLEVKVAVGHNVKPVKGDWVAPDRLADEALPSVMRKIVQYGLKSL